ncbi:hypothetical protein Tco_0943654 [Tanacetum coccineum]
MYKKKLRPICPKRRKDKSSQQQSSNWIRNPVTGIVVGDLLARDKVINKINLSTGSKLGCSLGYYFKEDYKRLEKAMDFITAKIERKDYRSRRRLSKSRKLSWRKKNNSDSRLNIQQLDDIVLMTIKRCQYGRFLIVIIYLEH